MSNRETRCTQDCTRPRGRMEHCKVCHQTFSGASTGDAHRTGRYGIDRRCRTSDELSALGLWLERGIWHGSPNKAGVQKRWNGPDTSGVADLSA